VGGHQQSLLEGKASVKMALSRFYEETDGCLVITSGSHLFIT